MKFRTDFIPEKASFSIDPSLPVVLLGSCFAQNIAGRMRRSLWNAVNPFSTLYNPLSIERTLRASILSSDRDKIFSDSIFDAGDRVCSWLADSRFSAESRRDVLAELSTKADELDKALKIAPVMFVTFGTSWCYFLADRPDYVVANCHKQPASDFIRRRVSVDEIVNIWLDLSSSLKEKYPQLRIVFTVSPVRHMKDGFAGNSHSKAVLLLAVEEICNRLDYCHYFPAYEIVNDDLRDYRFYASDLVHPSEEAVEYIWEIFRATYLDPAGEAILKEGEKLLKAWQHRPLPNATKEPSPERREKEGVRLNEIRLRHAAFLSLHPHMLPLP